MWTLWWEVNLLSVSCLPQVKEPAMKGHQSYREISVPLNPRQVPLYTRCLYWPGMGLDLWRFSSRTVGCMVTIHPVQLNARVLILTRTCRSATRPCLYPVNKNLLQSARAQYNNGGSSPSSDPTSPSRIVLFIGRALGTDSEISRSCDSASLPLCRDRQSWLAPTRTLSSFGLARTSDSVSILLLCDIPRSSDTSPISIFVYSSSVVIDPCIMSIISGGS